MKQRALDLGVLLEGQLASLGPEAMALSVRRPGSDWLWIRVEVATDTALRDLADELGLDPARTERRGKAWFRQAQAREGGLTVIVAGPVHQGPEGPPS